MEKQIKYSLFILVIIITIPNKISAHCDGLDGPVVKAAQKALETGDVNYVLIWVKKDYEQEIKNSFNKTLIVRKQSVEAKEIADMYFFETLVRLHRLGEGAPYTGLKPAGRDLGPVIPAADKAIDKKAIKELYILLTEELHKGLHHYFENVVNNKEYKQEDTEAGRKFVEAYVLFIHYVERLYEAAQMTGEGHFSEAADSHKH